MSDHVTIARDGSVAILPDGTAVFCASYPLPKDHWLYADHPNVPPMPLRVGLGEERSAKAEEIRAAARYAIRAATMNGKEQDFDPDAMVQNFIVGMLGYWTETGLSSDSAFNPPGLKCGHSDRAVCSADMCNPHGGEE